MIKRISALALVAFALSACASGGSKPAGAATPAPVKASPATAPTTSSCTACTVEVENRLDYAVLVFDKRDARGEVGTNIKASGRANGRATVVVQTKGRPNLGIAALQDIGVPPTMPKSDAKDAEKLVTCRQEAVRPDSKADFRYVCGN